MIKKITGFALALLGLFVMLFGFTWPELVFPETIKQVLSSLNLAIQITSLIGTIIICFIIVCAGLFTMHKGLDFVD